MSLTFTKMQGLGNDFVVVDAVGQQFDPSVEQIQRMADRHFGIGFDQLLVVRPTKNDNSDFYYQIFNKDGGEVEQCGNGARCVARFIYDQKLINKREFVLTTLGGNIKVVIEPDKQVNVEMGIPRFDPALIPFEVEQVANSYDLQFGNEHATVFVVNIGNPHAVIQVEDVDVAPVKEWGAKIETHPRFPRRTNVGFMQILSKERMRLRVFERGVGETLACGSGACAAATIGIKEQLLNNTVKVDLHGGSLSIMWEGGESSVWMRGPAEYVFQGNL